MITRRILYVCHMLSYPPGKGGQYRTYHIARLLQRFGDVTMLCFDIDQYPPIPTEEATREKFPSLELIRPEPQPERSFLKKRLDQLGMLFFNKPNIWNWPLLEGDQRRVKRLVEEHDLIWIERPYTINLLGDISGKPVVLDFDDLNHVKEVQIKEARDDWSGGGLKGAVRRFSGRLDSWLLKRWEVEQAKKASVYCVCSSDDASYFEKLTSKPASIVANGFEEPESSVWSRPDGPVFGFLGSQQYAPNRKGLERFVRDVWPHILNRYPEAELRVVGSAAKSTPSYEGVPGVNILGFVDSLKEEMARWVCMVVPIYEGGGTRIKILEAWARKCSVVSTGIGAHGLCPKNGETIFLEDEPERLAQRCVELYADLEMNKLMAERAYAHFCNSFTWDSVSSNIGCAIDCAMKKQSVGEKHEW